VPFLIRSKRAGCKSPRVGRDPRHPRACLDAAPALVPQGTWQQT